VKETIDGVDYYYRRPLALQACWRRAYREAKKLYTGQARAQTGTVDLEALREEARAFRHRVIDSIKAQPSQ
jgi:hypothetical protein